MYSSRTHSLRASKYLILKALFPKHPRDHILCEPRKPERVSFAKDLPSRPQAHFLLVVLLQLSRCTKTFWVLILSSAMTVAHVGYITQVVWGQRHPLRILRRNSQATYTSHTRILTPHAVCHPILRRRRSSQRLAVSFRTRGRKSGAL